MKKSTILALALFHVFAAGAQQINIGAAANLKAVSVCGSASPYRILSSTERAVGYTDGDSITTKDAYIGEAGTYKVFAIMPGSSLSAYAGCKIVGLRFALSQTIGKTTAFLYRVEGGVASDIQTVNVRRTSDGWNEIRFNASQEYSIGGDESLMYGFAYNESADMVAAHKGALCFYQPETPNASASQIEKDGGLYTMAQLGNLCVQLIVDVSSMPKKAVTMTNLLAGNKYHKAGSNVDAFVMYINTGLEEISSVRLGYRIDDGETTYVDNDETLKTSASGSVNPQFCLPEDLSSGNHTLSFFVDKIDGQPSDGAPTDTIEDKFVVYRQSAKRNCHYVEQYNSQENYHGALVNSQMNGGAAKDSVALVNLYQDGEPLAVDASLGWSALYAYTTPCFTIDRFYMMGEKYVAFDVNGYVTAIPQFWSTLVAPLFYEVDANPCFSTLRIKPAFDAATRTLSVEATGETVEELPEVVGDMALTLMISEDKVVSDQKVLNGNTVKTDRNYSHDNVLRAYMTPATGELVDLQDGAFKVTRTYDVPSTWNASNLKVVALLTRWLPEVTDSNVLDADVLNAATEKVPADETGINLAVQADATASPADGIYTLSGLKLPAGTLGKGIYVIRSGGKSRKVAVK